MTHDRTTEAPAVTRRRKPSFPGRDRALLWVDYNRSQGARIALTGLIMAALMGYRCFVSHGAVLWVVVSFASLGLLMLLIGLRLATRRTPLIAADESAMVASTLGTDRSLIPWEMISGAVAVGSQKAGRTLVILTDDVEQALKHVDPVALPMVRRQNQKLGLAGVLHIPGNMMGTPPDMVALRVQEIIGVPVARR